MIIYLNYLFDHFLNSTIYDNLFLILYLIFQVVAL